MSLALMTRRLVRPALVVAALLAPHAAFAQWTQTSSSADVELFRNRAEVSVMISVKNDAEEAVEAELGVAIGSGTATGLAMLGIGGDVWREGELAPGEAAMTRYLQMASGPVASQPLSALLSWSGPGSLALRMSVPAQGQQFTSYKFVAPVTYDAGVYRYELPALDGAVPGFVNVHLADKQGALTIDDVTCQDGVGRATIDAYHVVTYTVPTSEPVFGEVAILPTTKGQALVDYHIDLAPHLAEVPEHARVVVLMDASRSLSEADSASVVSAARSYLHAFEGHDARVALVAFDRSARVLAADPRAPFAPSADAVATLGVLGPLARSNGSDLELAFTKASELLAAESGAKRVVLFTDLATADRVTPATVAPRLPRGAIVHVVSIGSRGASLYRDDESAWAAVPRSTGGLAWGAGASEDDDAQRRIFEELARPMRIDVARVSPAADGSAEPLGAVAEGTRISSASLRALEGATVTLDGELWSQPLHEVFTPTAGYRKLAAAFVFGNAIHAELDAASVVAFANLAHAVSPVTSLVAKDAANAPFSLQSFGGSSLGGLSGRSSCSCGLGHGAGTGTGERFDAEAWLRREVLAIEAACDPGAAPKVTVESTLDEIVDVRVTGTSNDAASTCIEERVWALTLDPGFRQFGHLTTDS